MIIRYTKKSKKKVFTNAVIKLYYINNSNTTSVRGVYDINYLAGNVQGRFLGTPREPCRRFERLMFDAYHRFEIREKNLFQKVVGVLKFPVSNSSGWKSDSVGLSGFELLSF